MRCLKESEVTYRKPISLPLGVMQQVRYSCAAVHSFTCELTWCMRNNASTCHSNLK